jgi:hypothetical protein
MGAAAWCREVVSQQPPRALADRSGSARLGAGLAACSSRFASLQVCQAALDILRLPPAEPPQLRRPSVDLGPLLGAKELDQGRHASSTYTMTRRPDWHRHEVLRLRRSDNPPAGSEPAGECQSSDGEWGNPLCGLGRASHNLALDRP